MKNIVNQIRENTTTHMSFLTRQLTGGSVTGVLDDGDAVLIKCSVNDDTFNQVVGASFKSESVMDRRIPEITEVFTKTSTPFSWWVLPGDAPELGNRLLRHGYTLAEVNVPMFMNIGPGFTPKTNENLCVRSVQNLEDLTDYEKVQAGLMGDAIYEYYSLVREKEGCLLGEGGGNNEAKTLFVGYDKATSEPVCTGSSMLTGNTLGLYDVCTVQEYRGRGFATSLMGEMLVSGARSGATLAVLSASADAVRAGLYQRIGFRELADGSQVQEYSFDPSEKA